MNLNIFILSLCFFKMTIAWTPLHIDYMLIRNVGQGQWITHIQNDNCDHYDFGGEMLHLKAHKQQFIKDCSQKKNRLNLSHAHLDHFAFISLIVKNSRTTCWQTAPVDKINMHAIPYCDKTSSFTKIVHTGWNGKTKNDRSIVFTVKNFLLPGDSSSKKEKEWAKGSSVTEVKYLILGHHGSQTSTSHELLARLPKIQMAIVSARYQRYRHPSLKTVSKLKKYKVPLIKTEDWGNFKLY